MLRSEGIIRKQIEEQNQEPRQFFGVHSSVKGGYPVIFSA